MQSRLIEIINKYIDEYEELERKLDDITVKCELYKGLLSIFKKGYDDDNLENNKFLISIHLDIIYENNDMERDFFILLNKLKSKYTNKANEVRSFVSKLLGGLHYLEREQTELKNRVDRTRKIVISARKAKTCIGAEIPIKGYVFKDLNDIINYYNFTGVLSPKETVLCSNDLEYYNRNVITKKAKNPKEQEYASDIHRKIPDMFAMGYEVFSVPKIDERRRKNLENSLKSLKAEIDNIIVSKDNSYEKSLLEILKRYEKNIPDDKEYNYVLVNLIKGFQEELITVYDLTLNSEDSFKNKKDIVREYYEILKKFLIVRKYYDEINEIVEVDLTDEEMQEVQNQNQKKYIYSLTSAGNVRILSDMKNVPFEYYSDIEKLLEEFKKGKTSSGEVKALSNNNKTRGFIELKCDQVRIVLKHIKDDIYCIMGVFTKKANNDMTMYNTMCSRALPDVSTSKKMNDHLGHAGEVERELYEMIETKGRKNSR